MNAQGISVFYGATDASVAIAEVRAPVGGRVAVAKFRITRPLRFLDLTALKDVHVMGSIFDATLKRSARAGRVSADARNLDGPALKCLTMKRSTICRRRQLPIS
jgi:hypothetical protein